MTITAEIIADSINTDGVRITTFELVYPRIIHSEFMTHRLFSRNAASSRAIPVKAMLDNIKADVAKPVHWGKNQAGMQANEEHDAKIQGYTADEWWDLAALSACRFAEEFADAGYHKQVANRVTEAYSHIKVVLTATSYDNFFWLRNHEDADPTIHLLAVTMLAAFDASQPKMLLAGEWHTPYYGRGFWSPAGVGQMDSFGVTLIDALMISSSCCAQVSYRKNDDSLDKAKAVFARLVESAPVHASPTEHQATPCASSSKVGITPQNWPNGVTHMDRDGAFWSGNFKGWIQHRQLIPNHDCKVYTRD